MLLKVDSEKKEILSFHPQKNFFKILFTIVNWINKLQKIVKDSEKTSAHFKRGNHNKLLCKILTEIPMEKEILNFCKTQKTRF